MKANLTQILNFKANFHQEFELFPEKKFMLTMVDTLDCQHNKKNIKFIHIRPRQAML